MLKIHSLPEGEKKSALFGVCVNGIPVVPEFARVSAMPFNTPWPGHQRDLAQTEEAAFISFEGDESAVLDVECVVWQISIVHYRHMNVRHGICLNLLRRRHIIILANPVERLDGKI